MSDFESHQVRARDPLLSPNERSGFGSYRDGVTTATTDDIFSKLSSQLVAGSTLVDIGCGCSELTFEIIRRTEEMDIRLILVDGPQVIDAIGILPGHVIAYRHRFPDDTDFVQRYANSVDAVMMYSVIQCLSKEQLQIDVSLAAVGLLRPSGRLLIGDIPNASKKGRFLASEFGKRFDREWRSSLPQSNTYSSESRANEALAFTNPQDDASVVSLMLELRSAGFESYLLPQPEGLALNWSREDLLVVRW